MEERCPLPLFTQIDMFARAFWTLIPVAGLCLLLSQAGGCRGEIEDVSVTHLEEEGLDVSLPGDATADEEGTLRPPAVDVDPSDAEQVRMAIRDGEPPLAARAALPQPTPADDAATGEAAAAAASGPTEVNDTPAEDAAAAQAEPPPGWREWQDPAVVLAVTGQQFGYIEPCGCTGLENQKGGMMRRYTLLDQVRERGWQVVPLDAGNQVRRTGRQAAIKFQRAVEGLRKMQYRTIGLGPDDLQLGASELLSVAADDGSPEHAFASANIELLAPELMRPFQQIDVGPYQLGVTTAIDSETVGKSLDDGITISPLESAARETLQAMEQAGTNFHVLLLFGSAERAEQLAREVPGYELIVAAKTYGEPYYKAQPIEGSDTLLVKTGDKGMYVGLIGLFPGGELRYSRVALDDGFEDARPMLDLMAEYQNQLKALGLEGLQLTPKSHPSGGEFVGTERCGECHTGAYDIWTGTLHAEATEHIVHPGERSEIPRHFDPECLSCHVTGWDPQNYEPYESGYLSLEASGHLTGNGCENCHGPGRAHVEAEEGGGDYSDAQIEQLRAGMRLLLEDARDRCLECHDLDNSPDFHEEGAFEEYWAEVEHYGVD